ncbi:hypothetical protein B0H16DRAFT_1568554 [Mycena metata]|uniref:Uncharacterized protein n=1 Tax=Mycena metata TaxID=1033252 RepID=A0AAD7IBU8_9AGAR|nr:hypothetical protein B0H16DRAFT_1568554 [Mycena metata]
MLRRKAPCNHSVQQRPAEYKSVSTSRWHRPVPFGVIDTSDRLSAVYPPPGDSRAQRQYHSNMYRGASSRKSAANRPAHHAHRHRDPPRYWSTCECFPLLVRCRAVYPNSITLIELKLLWRTQVVWENLSGRMDLSCSAKLKLWVELKEFSKT